MKGLFPCLMMAGCVDLQKSPHDFASDSATIMDASANDADVAPDSGGPTDSGAPDACVFMSPEGPPDDPTCDDSVDNDCDGLRDEEAPGCLRRAYRSVGPGKSEYESGTSSLSIEGFIATFTASVSDDVGVGHVVSYRSVVTDPDALAIIHHRFDGAKFSVRRLDGGLPSPVSPTTLWSIRPAYASFSAIHNDFPSDFDLSTTGRSWHLVLYEGEDRGSVRIDWRTTPDHNLQVYTPTQRTRVGRSQRHDGTWGTGYRLPCSGSDGEQCVRIRAGHMRIRGIAVHTSVPAGFTLHVSGSTTAQNSYVRVSESVVRCHPESTRGIVVTHAEVSEVFNNIVYGCSRTRNPSAVAMFLDRSDLSRVYHNTVATSHVGFRANVAVTVLAKNNMVFKNTTDYQEGTGVFAASSDSNAYGNGNDSIGVGAVLVEMDPFTSTVTENYHLEPSLSDAYGVGADLRTDELWVKQDIDGDDRGRMGDPWYLGADHPTE